MTLTLKLIAYLVPALALAAIGFITFLKNTHDRLYLLFFTLAMTMAAWLVALCVGDLLVSPTVSLWALRVAACIGTVIIPVILYFSFYFPVSLQKPSRIFQFFALAPAIGFVVLALTPWLIPAVVFEQQSAQPDKLNVLYTLQSVYAVVGIIAGFVIMLRKFRRLAAREKAQIRLVILGLVVALVVNVVTGFALTFTNQAGTYSNLTGSLSFLVFVGATAYAIVKHRLFDIRLAITRTIGFTAAIGLVSVVYSLVVLGVGVPFISSGSVTLLKNQTQFLFLLPPTLLAALTFHSLEQFIAQRTRRVFYQDSYDAREVLDRFSDAIIVDNDLDKIMLGGLTVLRGAIKPVHVLLIVLNDKGEVYKRQLIDRQPPADSERLVREAMETKDRIVVKDDVPVGQWRRAFEEQDISLVLRLGSSKSPTGFLYLGPKRDGRTYNQQDIGLLTVSSKNFAVAIDNAKKYEQIAAFADTMHAEVLRATANLRRANKKLRTLDALKDDFISMASHQLRSPATSVRDAIKMLEQSYLTPKERRQILQLAEASSERLVSVVTDMLSVARIQAGHFTLEKTDVALVELVERALLQASVLAKEKDIALRFEKPKEAITLQADRAKLNEMMSNYIENAIKYSDEHTTVTIALKREAGRVHFMVDDQGIGVPADEQKDLFSKFFRTTNARHEQPNGNGIGLFVVKTIAEAHGGDVYYEPLAHGSRFGFWLPA